MLLFPKTNLETSSKKYLLNYEELSEIFSGKPVEFIRVLKMIHEDFLNNHMLIMDAIAEMNHEQFKKVYHNLRGNINLFDIYILRDLMNKIESGLEEENIQEDLVEDLHNQFNLISQSLENKIKELKA